MDCQSKSVLQEELGRCASLAQIGGFRPPEDPMTSWFGGRGVGLPGDIRPSFEGREMFSLLQVKVAELPHAPEELNGIAFLNVFIDREVMPFNRPHGETWLIREYTSMEGLQILPPSEKPDVVKAFPIKWIRVENDYPQSEGIGEVIAHDYLDLIDDNTYHEDFPTIEGTKVGGYPFGFQYSPDIEGFVFQIDSEYKAGWNWGDNGMAHFHKRNGEWSLEWQCL